MELNDSQLEALVEEQADEVEPSTSGWVVFFITDRQLNPDEITADLGFSPDRVQHPEPAENRDGIWQLNSRLPGQASLHDHFMDILKRLVPVHRQVWALSERFRLEFFCSIHKIGEATEPIHLPARALLLLGYLGADVEIEVSDA